VNKFHAQSFFVTFCSLHTSTRISTQIKCSVGKKIKYFWMLFLTRLSVFLRQIVKSISLTHSLARLLSSCSFLVGDAYSSVTLFRIWLMGLEVMMTQVWCLLHFFLLSHHDKSSLPHTQCIYALGAFSARFNIHHPFFLVWKRIQISSSDSRTLARATYACTCTFFWIY
jgi:hypothetical protein